MVHLREGGETNSPPHLVEAFGDQNPPKMGRRDPGWIIILFFIHLMLLEWKRWRDKLIRPFY